MNTIEKLGDEETFRNIIERIITEFEDSEIELIRVYAFENCTALTSVSLPVAKRIQGYAFQSCSNLTSVSIPSATIIENYAFNSCSKLTSVSFPGVTSIEGSAFGSCSALTSVSFPVATGIGDQAFSNCSKLTSVSFPVATGIGSSAFSSCTALTDVSFPVATSIGNRAFDSCSSLTSVSIPSATRIGDSAFYGCTALTSASFPVATRIEYYAFTRCSALSAIYVGTESETVCALWRADAIPSSIGAIYVPYNLVEKYKTATNWSSFADKIQGYEQPVACQSLTITADNVEGYQTTTTIHWEATCTYSIEGMMQPGTMVFKGDAVSDTFSKNPSPDSSKSIEVSYTFLGQTATTTITQSKYVGDPLGGTIFYIDDTADGAYEFYDAEGNVISSVAVGDAPARYKVLTPGTKDKYYIYNTTLYPSLQWGMYGTSTGATDTAIGTGKSNTSTVMATSAATTSGTIWYQLAQNRSNSLEGCTDWFIPSRYEMEEVRKSGLLSFSGKYIWSSSEVDSGNAWHWDYSNWYDNYSKNNSYSVFFVRAF